MGRVSVWEGSIQAWKVGGDLCHHDMHIKAQHYTRRAAVPPFITLNRVLALRLGGCSDGPSTEWQPDAFQGQL